MYLSCTKFTYMLTPKETSVYSKYKMFSIVIIKPQFRCDETKCGIFLLIIKAVKKYQPQKTVKY